MLINRYFQTAIEHLPVNEAIIEIQSANLPTLIFRMSLLP